MKNTFYSFVFLLFSSLAGFAQVSDHQVIDCQNDTSSIYAALASGKPLFIASKGTDCSICMNRAPALQQWATSNPNVVVWGAMTKIYSSNNPNCNEVAQWITQYNWTSIFTFVDTQKKWKDQGTPRYYVYDPKDSSLAYNGFDESLAKTTAENLAQQVGIAEAKQSLNQVHVRYAKKSWSLVNLPQGNLVVEVIDLTGSVLQVESIAGNAGNYSISTAALKPGIYLLKIRNKKGEAIVVKAVAS